MISSAVGNEKIPVGFGLINIGSINKVDSLRFALIEAIDFSMIEKKLQVAKSEHGRGWSQKKAKKAIDLYKKWLYLVLENPKEGIVPTVLIDDVWHQHILDTRAYKNDCQNVFGHFLHHFPYFGMRGGDDKEKLAIAFEKTQIRFKNVWGESMGNAMHASMCDGSGSMCEGGSDMGNCGNTP